MTSLSSKNLWIVAVVALFFGLLFSWFFVGKQAGIAFPLYIILLVGALFVQFYYFKIPYNKKTIWYILPLLFFSGMVAFRASEVLLFWNVAITFGLLVVFANHHLGKNIKKYLLVDYVKTAVLIPLTFLGRSFNSLAKMFTVSAQNGDSQKKSQIAKGVLITLPIAVFFIILMSSADLVFGKLVYSIFNFNISPELVAKFWWMLIVGFCLLGSFSHILEFSSGTDLQSTPAKPITYKFGSLEAGILFGSLNVLFAVFVFIQIKYLFAGHNAISEFGLTYAQYAHKGFAELVFMALISFFLIFGVDKYIEKKDGRHSRGFLVLSGIMTALLVVIMASAFTRLLVYEQAYGFTLLRILVQGFIIWLAAVFVWLGYKIISHRSEDSFVFGMFVLVIIFFTIFNLLNPDAFIARKNIDQFAKSNKLDTNYLATLSADAEPEIKTLLEYNGFTNQFGDSLPKEAQMIMNEIKDRSVIRHWQSFNFSRASLKNNFEAKLPEF